MMERRAPSIPRRAVVTLLTLGITCAAFGLHAPRAEAATPRSKLFRLINHSRTRHDLRRVKLDRSLSRDARRWSRVMLRKDRIYDPPRLSQILAPYDWKSIGADVVGCGGTVHVVHRAMMRDGPHRAIILNSKVRRVGVGVVLATTKNRCGRGSVWVTEIYYG
jgi:hypothetical protein